MFLAGLAFALIPRWPSSDEQNALIEAARRAPTADEVASPPSTTATAAPGVVDPARPDHRESAETVATAGDSSMMFMNAAIAETFGAGRWVPVPADFEVWTSGTGGFDRNGCGPTGDDYLFHYNSQSGGREPRSNHAPEPESTCDWRKWLPQSLSEVEPDVLVLSFGPTSMWGLEVGGQVGDLTDAHVYEAVHAAYVELRRAVLAAGVERVVWVAYPPIENRSVAERYPGPQYWTDGAVPDRLYELLAGLGDPVVDLRDMTSLDLYRDGTHFNEHGAALAAERILEVVGDCAARAGASRC